MDAVGLQARGIRTVSDPTRVRRALNRIVTDLKLSAQELGDLRLVMLGGLVQNNAYSLYDLVEALVNAQAAHGLERLLPSGDAVHLYTWARTALRPPSLAEMPDDLARDLPHWSAYLDRVRRLPPRRVGRTRYRTASGRPWPGASPCWRRVAGHRRPGLATLPRRWPSGVSATSPSSHGTSATGVRRSTGCTPPMSRRYTSSVARTVPSSRVGDRTRS